MCATATRKQLKLVFLFAIHALQHMLQICTSVTFNFVAHLNKALPVGQLECVLKQGFCHTSQLGCHPSKSLSAHPTFEIFTVKIDRSPVNSTYTR